MLLSDIKLQERLINSKEVEQAKQWWKNGDWGKIGDKILIEPVTPENMGLNSYDLTVGEEYLSLMDPENIKQVGGGQSITIAPGETVLILTEEYICLPKNLMGMIIPRARWIFEGTNLNASKVDPTWYGKLFIGFTNDAKYPIALYRGEAFCTCYFMECHEATKALSKKDVPHLGRIKIGRVEFKHARQQKILTPEEVTKAHIKGVVDAFGYPYDVVMGAIELAKTEIIHFIERDIAPTIIEQAVSTTTARAYSEQQKWFKILVSGIIAAFFTLVGILGYLFTR